MIKISNRTIKSRLRKKTNPELVETSRLAMKNKAWFEISKVISASTRTQIKKNFFEIDKEAKIGDTIIIPGKILSKGFLTKKIKLCSLSISSQALDRLKETKSEFHLLRDEIKKNPKAEGIKILR